MNQNSPNQEGVRKPVLIAIGVIALTAGGFILMSMRGGKPEKAPETVQEAPTTHVARSAPAAPAAETAAPEPIPPPPVAAADAPTNRLAASPAAKLTAIPRGLEPSAETRRLVRAWPTST